jgi:anaerobic magnesium-protoporphyrin IX monomethyl ester cyclase
MTEPGDQPVGSGTARRGIRVALISFYLPQPLGLRQIHALLRERGHDPVLVFFKEFRQGEFTGVTPAEEEMLISLVRDLDVQLVGISVATSFVADLAYRTSDRIRSELGIRVALGGTHATVCPEECIEHADFVCRGEGEEAAADLADAIAAEAPIETIPNLWVRVNGEVHRNDVRSLVQDIDQYPLPSYVTPDSYYIEEGQLRRLDPSSLCDTYHTMASRMCCPLSCSFCTSGWLRGNLYADKGRRIRYRSVSSIIAEINEARRRNPKLVRIWFWDEILGAGAPKGWLQELAERFPAEVGLPFETFGHVSWVSEERIGLLKAAGLSFLWLGVESGSEQVRREVLNRREKDAQVLEAADILRRLDIEVGYEFILDIPWLTEENCRGTFEMLMQLPRPFTVHLHSLSFLPRTAITVRALEEGVIRPEQVARADQPLVERFESHFWQYSVRGGHRRSACWHSLIYLATVCTISRRLLRVISLLLPLLQFFPRPLVLAAQVVRNREETGDPQIGAAVQSLYPGLGALVAGRPTLRRVLSRGARLLLPR